MDSLKLDDDVLNIPLFMADQSELSDENSERFRSIREIKIRKESIV